MRFVALLVCLFAPVVLLNATNIGVSVDGTCEAGICPPATVPMGTAQSLPFDLSLTLADGDMYQIFGSFNDTNTGVLAGGTNHLFQVTYEGNANGGVSSADSITVQADYAIQTTASSEFISRDIIGSFGPTIAASSSASSCLVGGTEGCSGTLTPPGAFNVGSNSFVFPATNGVYLFDPYFTSNFGAGSPVGSYIVWGQDAALPTPTPEPTSLSVCGLALIALAVGVGRLRKRFAR